MKIIKERQNLPIFYHIPKNAGTYVMYCMRKMFNAFITHKINAKYHPLYKRNINILKNGKIVFRFVVLLPISASTENTILNSMKWTSENSNQENLNWSYSNYDIKDLKVLMRILKNVFIFCVFVESSGFRIREELYKFFEDYNILNFLVLRDPFDRIVSLYNYTNSSRSKHEISHKFLKDISFVEYINSNLLETNWIIKNLLNIDDSTKVDDTHFERVVDMLERDFYVIDMKTFDTDFIKFCKKCFGFKTMDKSFYTPPMTDKTNWKNSTEYKKIKLNSLPKEVSNRFETLSYYDKLLYERFKKK